MIDTNDHPEAAIILFTGYSQKWGPGSGLWRLRDKLAHRYHDRRRFLVALRTWDDSAKATAELVRWSKPKRLYVVSYSYGVGWATNQFADELNGERAIDALFAIDAIPRYRFIPLKAISLTRWGTYKVPRNVRTCYGYRQVMGSPYGRRCESVNGTAVQTRMVMGSRDMLEEHAPTEKPRWQVVSDINHSGIDDSEQVHDDVMHLLSTHIERAIHARA